MKTGKSIKDLSGFYKYSLRDLALCICRVFWPFLLDPRYHQHRSVMTLDARFRKVKPCVTQHSLSLSLTHPHTNTMHLQYWWNKHRAVSALCPLFVHSNHNNFPKLLAIIIIIIIVLAASFFQGTVSRLVRRLVRSRHGSLIRRAWGFRVFKARRD